MFNAYRRGPTSISSITRVFRAAPTSLRIPSTRPSTLSLSFQNVLKPVQEGRWLHLSSQLQQRWGSDSGGRAFDEGHAPPTNDNFPTVTKFDELIEHNLVHPNVVRAITKGMGHSMMTEVQSMTINQALQGTDMYECST